MSFELSHKIRKNKLGRFDFEMINKSCYTALHWYEITYARIGVLDSKWSNFFLWLDFEVTIALKPSKPLPRSHLMAKRDDSMNISVSKSPNCWYIIWLKKLHHISVILTYLLLPTYVLITLQKWQTLTKVIIFIFHSLVKRNNLSKMDT